MAAPSFVAAGNDLVTTGSLPASFPDGSVGDVLILQVLQDGTGSAPSIAFTSVTGKIENLAGTDDAMTSIGSFAVGSPTAANQFLWIGRALVTTGAIVDVSTPGNDLYIGLYRFSGVNTGTALSDVIENASAGIAQNEVGTSATVNDCAVQTLGADRLACNFIAVNDDNDLSLTAMTGETGGDWTYPATAFGSSTGTDGAVALVTATIASAGTIDGGSDAMAASDAWGVVGFALIPASSFATYNIAAALDISPAIDSALGRETFISIPDDLGMSIVTALSRETFIASALDISPTIDSNLSFVHSIAAEMALGMVIDTALSRETFIASAQDLSPTIDSAFTRETFIAASENFGPSIVTALSRETFISLAENLGPTIFVDLTLVPAGGGVEHFISAAMALDVQTDTALTRETFLAADMPLGLTIDTALTRETFISAAHNLNAQIQTALTRETFISSAMPLELDITVGLTREMFIAADMDLALDFATRLVMELFMEVDMPLDLEIFVNIAIDGQVGKRRMLLGVGK